MGNKPSTSANPDFESTQSPFVPPSLTTANPLANTEALNSPELPSALAQFPVAVPLNLQPSSNLVTDYNPENSQRPILPRLAFSTQNGQNYSESIQSNFFQTPDYNSRTPDPNIPGLFSPPGKASRYALNFSKFQTSTPLSLNYPTSKHPTVNLRIFEQPKPLLALKNRSDALSNITLTGSSTPSDRLFQSVLEVSKLELASTSLDPFPTLLKDTTAFLEDKTIKRVSFLSDLGDPDAPKQTSNIPFEYFSLGLDFPEIFRLLSILLAQQGVILLFNMARTSAGNENSRLKLLNKESFLQISGLHLLSTNSPVRKFELLLSEGLEVYHKSLLTNPYNHRRFVNSLMTDIFTSLSLLVPSLNVTDVHILSVTKVKSDFLIEFLLDKVPVHMLPSCISLIRRHMKSPIFRDIKLTRSITYVDLAPEDLSPQGIKIFKREVLASSTHSSASKTQPKHAPQGISNLSTPSNADTASSRGMLSVVGGKAEKTALEKSKTTSNLLNQKAGGLQIEKTDNMAISEFHVTGVNMQLISANLHSGSLSSKTTLRELSNVGKNIKDKSIDKNNSKNIKFAVNDDTSKFPTKDKTKKPNTIIGLPSNDSTIKFANKNRIIPTTKDDSQGSSKANFKPADNGAISYYNKPYISKQIQPSKWTEKHAFRPKTEENTNDSTRRQDHLPLPLSTLNLNSNFGVLGSKAVPINLSSRIPIIDNGLVFYPPEEGWLLFPINNTGKFDSGSDKWLDEWTTGYISPCGYGKESRPKASQLFRGGSCQNRRSFLIESILSEDVGPNKEKWESRTCGTGVFVMNRMDCVVNKQGYTCLRPVRGGEEMGDRCFLIGMMVKVRPDMIRMPGKCEDCFWVVNDPLFVRPIGLMIREVTEEQVQWVEANYVVI